MEKRRKRTLIIVGVILVVIIVTLAVLIRGQRVSDYTVNEHVARITERAKERYLKDKFSKYTDCKVYPLYDANDKFANYCVVELQPAGCIFIEVNDVNLLLHLLFGTNGMYSRCRSRPGIEWRRYKIASDGEEQITDGDRQWIFDPSEYTPYYNRNRIYEADGDGQFIFHTDSPYKIANIVDERRYLLDIDSKHGNYIPAVKRGDKYLNLVSMEEFEYNNTLDSESFPCFFIGISHRGYDL